MNESGELDFLAKECYQYVRWDFSSEQARLAKWTADKSTSNISIEKKHLRNAAAVFSMHISCLNGRRMTRKNFSKPPISTKVKVIGDT